MLIAQISDTHVTRPGLKVGQVIDTNGFLDRAIGALNALDPLPDLVVITGDLVDHGEAEEYDHFRVLLAPLHMPVLVIPGNHDAREPLRAAFAGNGHLPADGFLQFVVEDSPLRIVALDTLVPGEVGGELCEERLAWLARALASAPERPTVLLMHHPPFATGIDWMDGIGLRSGGPALADIVRRNPQIQRILCGHVHRAIDCRFAGTVAGTAPSTAHQLVLDLRTGSGVGFAFEPPGYQLHRWDPSGGLVTHTAVIGDWPRLYPVAPGKLRVG